MTNWNSLTWCWQYVSSLLALIKIVVASQHKRQRKKSLSRFVDSWKHRLGLESALATLCKWATCSRQTFKNLFLPYSLPSLWKIWQLSLFDHPTWCVWIRADICRWDGAICSKKKLSHIIRTRRFQDLPEVSVPDYRSWRYTDRHCGCCIAV